MERKKRTRGCYRCYGYHSIVYWSEIARFILLNQFLVSFVDVVLLEFCWIFRVTFVVFGITAGRADCRFVARTASDATLLAGLFTYSGFDCFVLSFFFVFRRVNCWIFSPFSRLLPSVVVRRVPFGHRSRSIAIIDFDLGFCWFHRSRFGIASSISFWNLRSFFCFGFYHVLEEILWIFRVTSQASNFCSTFWKNVSRFSG